MSYPDGVVMDRRTMVGMVVDSVRDPILALPSACSSARMVLTRDFGQSRAFISDPALIHELLVRNADALNKTPLTKRALGPLLGEGLLTSDGGTWRCQRQTLAPGFQHEKLTALLPMMISAAETTRDRLLALPKGAIVDLGHEMMRTTFQVILDTMLSGPEGIRAEQVERGLSDYLKATPWMLGAALLKVPGWVPYPGKGRAAAASRRMRETVQAHIAARRTVTDRPVDLIETLLAAVDPGTGTKMADAAITDNILTFIVAGYETTAVALGWTLALLADHPDQLERLRAEIQAVTGDGPVRPAHVPMLTFARQVISESMRLYPPVPLILRQLLRDIEVGGAAIQSGSIFFIPIYAMHRRASLWPDPERFDPDRFTNEAVKARHRFAYMPFGAGPRVCIGGTFAMLEAVAVLVVLMKAMRLDRVDAALPPATMQLTLRPKRPIRMRVSPG